MNIPYFNQTMVLIEAENFSVPVTSRWAPREWGHREKSGKKTGDDRTGFFAATVANTFHSRRDYLNGPADASPRDTAHAIISVTAAGDYNVLARYEHGYRFNAAFQVNISSDADEIVFTRAYGYRENLKLWAFAAARNGAKRKGGGFEGGLLCGNKGFKGTGLVAECMWPYGATENIVWEGIGAKVTLTPGTYTITIAGLNAAPTSSASATGEPEETLFCQRNIDAILLHPNATDIAMRSEQEGPMLPLDGLLSQAGDVFFQVENLDVNNWINLSLPYTYIHPPYFTMHMTFPVCIR